MALDVKTPKGYRKAWNGSPRKMTKAELIDAVKDCLRRSEMSYTERFELDAERFYRLTGYMAPGKVVDELPVAFIAERAKPWPDRFGRLP